MAAPTISGGYTSLQDDRLVNITPFPTLDENGNTIKSFTLLAGTNFRAGTAAVGEYDEGIISYSAPLDLSSPDRALIQIVQPGDSSSRAGFIETVANNGISMLISDGVDNYKQWTSSGNGAEWDEVDVSVSQRPIVIFANSSGSVFRSSGSPDYSTIGNVYLLARRDRTNDLRLDVPTGGYLDPVIVTDGDITTPGTLATLRDNIGSDVQFLVGRSGGQDGSQYQLCIIAEIGNGTAATYFAENGKSILFRGSYGGTGNDAYRHFDSNTLGFSSSLTSSCVVRFANCSFSSLTAYHMRFNTSAGADVRFTGCAFDNAGDVSFGADVLVSGGSFSNCGRLLVDGAELRNVVVEGYSDGTGVLLKPSSTLDGVDFIASTAADYAIEIDTSGSYTLTDVSFSGHTTDINVTATSGTVTISIAGGATPTFVTAGATVEVVSGASLTLTGVLAGSDVVITDDSITSDGNDNNVVARFSDVAGGNVVYTYTSAPAQSTIAVYKAGFKPNFTTGYVLGASDASLPINQVADPAYEA